MDYGNKRRSNSASKVHRLPEHSLKRENTTPRSDSRFRRSTKAGERRSKRKTRQLAMSEELKEIKIQSKPCDMIARLHKSIFAYNQAWGKLYESLEESRKNETK